MSSVQCRQKVKLNNANVHSSIVEHKREKESAYNYVCVQFSVGQCQWIHICVHMYVLVCVCVCQWCIFVSLLVCAGGEWGSVVRLCVEGPGCSPDFSWELQWSMSSAKNRKSKPPTS